MNETINREEELKRRRRKRRRRRRIKRFFFVLTCLLLLCAMILLGAFIIKKITTPTEKEGGGLTFTDIDFSKIVIPEYVDIQLIDKGGARTGEKLDSINDIVIHYVGNPGVSAQNNRNYFAQDTTEVCSHLIVGLDGEVIQCVPLDEKSAASNNRNSDTISIEVCHPDESGKFNDSTYDSLVKLTAWLCKTFKLDENNVIRHYDVTGKECPLYYVENPDAWKDFLKDIDTKLK